MEMKVNWTQFAEDKLEDIYNYYKFKAGNIVAYELINGITETTSILYQYPGIGQQEELLLTRVGSFRYLMFKNYKIIYRVNEIDQIVLIVHVFDTRQNPLKISDFAVQN